MIFSTPPRSYVSHQNWHYSVKLNGGYRHAKFERLVVSEKKKKKKKRKRQSLCHGQTLIIAYTHCSGLPPQKKERKKKKRNKKKIFNRLTRHITKDACWKRLPQCSDKQNSKERGLQCRTSQRQLRMTTPKVRSKVYIAV